VENDIDLDESSPLGSDGFHCVEHTHQMGELLLNLALGEPLSLVQELPCSDNLIKLDPLLVSSINMSVPDMINGFIFHAVMVELCWCYLFCDLRCVQ
jgi:hypothetical protein